MEIKLERKDIYIFIVSLLGAFSFFMPWVSFFGGNLTGYSFVELGLDAGESSVLILLLLPISFGIVAASRLGFTKRFHDYIIRIFEVAPFFLFAIALYYIIDKMGMPSGVDEGVFELLAEVLGLGFYITIIGSFILLAAPKPSYMTKNQWRNNNDFEYSSVYSEENVQKVSEQTQAIMTYAAEKGGTGLKQLVIYLKQLTIFTQKYLGIAFDWIKNNKVLTGSIAVVLIGVAVAYYVFFKNYPDQDGLKAAKDYCTCAQTYANDLEKDYTEFLNVFGKKNYSKRSEAEEAFEQIKSAHDTVWSNCMENSGNQYQELKARYEDNYDKTSKFETAYNEFECDNPAEGRKNRLEGRIYEAISSIRDPEPSLAQIKSDLIGRSITGWKFTNESEIKSLDKSLISSSSDYIRYLLTMKLESDKYGKHDCEAEVTYRMGSSSWYMDGIKMKMITYTNVAKVGQWLGIEPLSNSSYTVTDTGGRFWIKDGSYGRTYRGGPGGEAFRLRSSKIYIKSRENYPVDLVFRYTANE